MKTREFFAALFLSAAAIAPAAATGSSDAHLYPEATDGAWQRAFNALNEDYGGEAGTYAGTVVNESVSAADDVIESGSYSLTVEYKDAAPYVISAQELTENNQNYYYGEKNGKNKDTFLGFETGSSTHLFLEKYLHQFAFPTPTKNTGKTEVIYNAAIRIYYTLANGEERHVDIPVVFERRDCEAYSQGVWTKSGDGWIKN